ncbi:Glutamate receptor-like 47, partial [Homarus americanus]
KPTVFEFADNATRLADARGYAADLLRLIQKRLNFSDVILPVVGFGSIIENGSWNGMIGVLSRQEADMGPLDFSPDAQRSQVVEFGEPYSMDGVVILCEAPSILVRPFLLLNIFSPLVWACLVGVAMAAGVFVGGVVVAEARLLGSWAGGGRSVGGDRSRCWPRNPSGRVVSAVVMLVALVVGSVPVNSAEDLVQRDMTPVFRAKTTVYNFILKQKGGVLGQLKARMKTVESEVLTTWQFLSKCKYHLARHLVRVDFDTFAFARNSFLIHQFDEIMRRLRHGGIIGHMQKQYYQLPCESVQRQVGPEPMSLAQVQGAFYVLGTGVILATSTLLTEIVVHACCRKSTAHHLSGLLPGSSPWVPSFGHLDEN